MFGLKYRSTSDERCRSTEEECLRSMVVSECRSMRLVFESRVADENQATNKCYFRSMRNIFLCGLSVPSLHDLMRIAIEFPCCFWYCWHVPEKTRKVFVSESGFEKKPRLNKIKSIRRSKLPGNGAIFDIN